MSAEASAERSWRPFFEVAGSVCALYIVFEGAVHFLEYLGIHFDFDVDSVYYRFFRTLAVVVLAAHWLISVRESIVHARIGVPIFIALCVIVLLGIFLPKMGEDYMRTVDKMPVCAVWYDGFRHGMVKKLPGGWVVPLDQAPLDCKPEEPSAPEPRP